MVFSFVDVLLNKKPYTCRGTQQPRAQWTMTSSVSSAISNAVSIVIKVICGAVKYRKHTRKKGGHSSSSDCRDLQVSTTIENHVGM